MHLVNPRENSKAALDSMFAAKYPWLLRWAMHFVQNDRAAAEDLVQDTFLRILSLHNEVSNLDDIKPLLYTHLRFAFLTERRRELSQTFLGFGAVDFDTFAITLCTSESTSFNLIESQNELRKILAFLLWRRRSAKFASLFLLRFFHGFSPEEIASICLVSRHSVDLSLGYAREELNFTYYAADLRQSTCLSKLQFPLAILRMIFCEVFSALRAEPARTTRLLSVTTTLSISGLWKAIC